LKFGCEVEELRTGDKEFFIHQENVCERPEEDVVFLTDKVLSPQEFDEIDFKEWYKIIGRPIRLSDVLRMSIINVDKKFKTKEIRKTNYTVQTLEILARWNLEKDDLNDQSEETIDFLLTLINN